MRPLPRCLRSRAEGAEGENEAEKAEGVNRKAEKAEGSRRKEIRSGFIFSGW